MSSTIAVAKLCIVCDEDNIVHMPVEAYNKYVHEGLAIQNAWPNSTPDEREGIITGTHPACWETLYG